MPVGDELHARPRHLKQHEPQHVAVDRVVRLPAVCVIRREHQELRPPLRKGHAVGPAGEGEEILPEVCTSLGEALPDLLRGVPAPAAAHPPVARSAEDGEEAALVRLHHRPLEGTDVRLLARPAELAVGVPAANRLLKSREAVRVFQKLHADDGTLATKLVAAIASGVEHHYVDLWRVRPDEEGKFARVARGGSDTGLDDPAGRGAGLAVDDVNRHTALLVVRERTAHDMRPPRMFCDEGICKPVR